MKKSRNNDTFDKKLKMTENLLRANTIEIHKA